MEIDEKLLKQYEGNIRCDLCGQELEIDQPVDTIQTGMYIEDGGDVTIVQYGEDEETVVLCRSCSPKVKVVVIEERK